MANTMSEIRHPVDECAVINVLLAFSVLMKLACWVLQHYYYFTSTCTC